MDAAQTIRDCIADVTALRLHRTGDPALGAAVGSVKSLQARRFRGTYADLMGSPAFGPAAQFFLEELYSDTDYTDRDLQFGRIAGTLQTMFPQPVVTTAVALAVLHAQRPRRLQLADLFEDGERRRNVLALQIELQRIEINVAADARMGEDGF